MYDVKLNFVELANELELFIICKRKFEEEYIIRMQSILKQIKGNWENDTGKDLSSIENAFNVCIASMQKNIIDFSNELIKTINNMGVEATRISYKTRENSDEITKGLV